MRSPFTPILIEACNPGPMTGRGNNTYLLLGGTGDAVLVDAGVGDPRHLDAIDHQLQERPARLVRVVATHGHSDHVAGAPHVARRHPAAIFSKRHWPGHDTDDPVRWRPLADGEAIDAGGEMLTVVETPGHSPDHIALWHAPTRAALVGDLVIQGGSVMIHASRGGSMRDYLASLERLIRLEPITLYPAHGAVIAAPIPLLQGYIAHRLLRERQVVSALGRGLSTVPAIADSIYDGLDPALVPAARENVRAHLDKLNADGLAVNEGDGWSLNRT